MFFQMIYYFGNKFGLTMTESLEMLYASTLALEEGGGLEERDRLCKQKCVLVVLIHETEWLFEHPGASVCMGSGSQGQSS